MWHGVFNKTIILLGLAGYEMITINVAPRWLYIISYPARPRRIIFKYLTIITRDDLISNKRDWNNYFLNNAPKILGKSSRFYFFEKKPDVTTYR